MTTQFSYDVLKNIFEHLALEKRLQIGKFCPNLLTAEQKSPLRIGVLEFYKSCFKMDQLIFAVGCTHFYDEHGSKYSTRVRIHRNNLNNVIYEATLPKKSEDCWKGFLDLCLANRDTVNVRQIICILGMDIIPNLPKGLKIECRELKIEYLLQLKTIKAIHPFLNAPFPEKVSICLDSGEDLLLEEEVVKQAKFLVISKYEEWSNGLVEQLTDLENEKIHVEAGKVQFQPTHVMRMAESWLGRCPDVGTQFTVEAEMYDYVLDVMDLLKENLGAVRGEVLEEELRNSALRHCVTIEMRSGHELNVFGGRTIEKKKTRRWLLRMEVMRKGSSRVVNRV